MERLAKVEVDRAVLSLKRRGVDTAFAKGEGGSVAAYLTVEVIRQRKRRSYKLSDMVPETVEAIPRAPTLNRHWWARLSGHAVGVARTLLEKAQHA